VRTAPEIRSNGRGRGRLVCEFWGNDLPTNQHLIPELVRWAIKHNDVVHGLVFITYRAAPSDGTYNYMVEGKPLPDMEVPYLAPANEEPNFDFTSRHVYAKIKEAIQTTRRAHTWEGTQSHDSIKWLIGVQVGAKGESYGAVGQRLPNFRW